MVPEGWNREPLVNVAQVRTGVAKGNRTFIDPISVPYLRVANVQDGRIDLKEVKEIEIERSKLERYRLLPGDVLMTEGGDFDKLGRGDVWRGQIEPCVTQNHVFAVRPDQNRLQPYFLAALASSHYGRTYFLSCAKKSTNLASINSSQLKEFPVLVPPQDEQRSICKILQTWDRAISNIEALIRNSEAQKTALMQQLLTGKRRLPGFAAPWQSFRLGQLFSERKETGFEELPLLSITRDRGVVLQDDVGRKDSSSTDKSSYKRICPGDIGYNTMRMWQGVSALSDKLGIVSPAYTIVKPSAEVDPEFMAQLFKSPRTIHDFYRFSQGLVSDTWNLKFPNFSQIKVCIPNLDEQRSIARVFQACEKRTQSLKGSLEVLKCEKRALMQQLLTGKKRLCD